MQDLDRRIAEGEDGIGRECHKDTTQGGAAGCRRTGIGCNRGHWNLKKKRWKNTESVRCKQLYDEMDRISIGLGINYCFSQTLEATQPNQFPRKPSLSSWLGETRPLTV